MIIAAREKDFALTAAFGCFVRKECRLAVKHELAINDLLMYTDKSMLSATIERALGKDCVSGKNVQLTLNMAGLRIREPQVRISFLNAQWPLLDSRVTPSV
jgi:hypothetical protein